MSVSLGVMTIHPIHLPSLVAKEDVLDILPMLHVPGKTMNDQNSEISWYQLLVLIDSTHFSPLLTH